VSGASASSDHSELYGAPSLPCASRGQLTFILCAVETPTTPPRRGPAELGDPQSTITPEPDDAAASVAGQSDAPRGEDLDEAILRYLRRWPNQTVDLAQLAKQLNIEPDAMQLAVERLHRRRMVVAPFIVPSPAGGGTLSEVGLRWLLEREGGQPDEVPVLLRKATEPVRAADEAARLPRAQVYGVRRQVRS